MVDFSTRATDINAQIQPDTQVLNPVTREGEINALNQIGKGLGTAVRVARTAFDNQATLDANKRLAGFSLDLSRLQDAEAQGLSTAEVQTRARRRLQQELANNPNAEQDILQRYSTWQSQSGYNKISTPDIQAAEVRQAQIKNAVDNGFLSADQINNPAAAEKAIDDLENFQRTVRELEMSSKEIANKSSKIELAGKEKAAVQAEAEQTLTQGLAKVGKAALPYWRTQYENIKNAATRASTEQERQQILKQGVIQLEQDFAQRTAAMSGDALNLPQAKIDQILKPQKDLIDVYKKELSGEYDAETVKRQVELVQNRTKLMVWEGLNDEQKQWVATAEILGPAAVVLQNKLSTIVVDMFQKNGNSGGSTGAPDDRGVSSSTKPADLTHADPVGKANTKNYLDGVTKAIDTYNSGQYDKTPDQKAKLLSEIDAQMKGILKGVNIYANSTESADQFQPLIDFFANPTVGEYLRSSGGIPASIRGEVARVFQDGYQKEVIPLLQNEVKAFDKMTVDNVDGKFLDFFQPTMVGGRFGFEIKPEISNNPSRHPMAQQRLNRILRDVNNSSFTKVLNKMIISDSHIQGTDDYSKSYETIAPFLFGTEDKKTSPDNVTTGEGLRPFKPGEQIDNGDGTISTERTETFQLEDGSWVNVPSLWMGPTGPVDFGGDEEGILYNMKNYEDAGGPKFKRFKSLDDAEKAAKERSLNGGAASGPRSEIGITSNTKVASLQTDIVSDVMNAASSGSEFTLEDLMAPLPSGDLAPDAKLTKAASGEFTGDASNFVGKTDPLEIARSFDGLSEGKDAKVIASFIKKSAGININPATTAWCAAFVNAVLGASGSDGTGKLNARSFLDWGKPVSKPSEGDVVVLERGGKNSWKGHVGFYVGEEVKDGERYIRVLSGNQSDSVNESLYPAKKILGFRRAA